MAESLTKGKIFLREAGIWLKDFVIMTLVVVMFQQFIVAPFEVNGASMETSLQDKEVLLVDKMSMSKYITHTPDLQHSDIVVIVPPTGADTHFVKRIIGLPGDVVSFEEHHVTVNGMRLEDRQTNCLRTESQVDFPAANPAPCNYGFVQGKSFTVPEGHYFVMGDNRDRSSDSRNCFGTAFKGCEDTAMEHFVPFENITGKVLVVVWPFTSMGFPSK